MSLAVVTGLKSCPFCGCSVICRYKSGDSHYLYCADCSAKTRVYSVITDDDTVNRAWQKRTSDDGVISR